MKHVAPAPTVSIAPRTSSTPIVIHDSDSETGSEDELSVQKGVVNVTTVQSKASQAPGVIVGSAGSSVSLGKRKADPTPLTASGSSRFPDGTQNARPFESGATTRDAKRQRISSPAREANPSQLASKIFHNGTVLPTATEHAQARADGRAAITFQDIVGPSSGSDLELAILSTYNLSYEWLAPHFDVDVPVILVTATGQEGSGPTTERLFPNENWVQTCPRINFGGCMHMKYMLLFYKSGRLRVVVSTANLVSKDWNDLENAVFVQDIFRKSSSMSSAAGGFATVMESVLTATNVESALKSVKQTDPNVTFKTISDLSKLWEWRSVTAELVPSVARKWQGWKEIRTTGHPRLMCALEALGLTTSKTQNLVLECQGSSIGMYTTQWINQFYVSASGKPAALKAHLDISESKRKKAAYPPGVKIVFPSRRTVRGTAGHGADSLFCTRKKWEAKNFPRLAFHDSRSRAGPVLMHTKMIIGSFSQKQGNSESIPAGAAAAGWMYVGSHNFTPPAWGNLSGSADAPVLNVNNYELGVVLPLKTAGELDEASAWQRPPRKYAVDDLPWVRESTFCVGSWLKFVCTVRFKKKTFEIGMHNVDRLCYVMLWVVLFLEYVFTPTLRPCHAVRFTNTRVALRSD
ncbi:tyrosyl-DNA phosphodiesterase-domain-containing protein [Mycena pura]|uniref:Tyrosyl-DNA phosphodiesterase-domain-containing protein n=1 Tax=Mycena pura TaxID=153505 RepID=A0AAD6YVG4_9AGAR|nr:tyrosyl-DNA phosphodiesterase-domain-containing protein [Mycena pura]